MAEVIPPPAEPLRQRGSRHQGLGYYGRPGVYLLHFDRPTADSSNGDGQHYVGETGDVTARLRQHADAWAQRARVGALRLTHAGREGIGYHCAAFREESDAHARVALERAWQRDPVRECSTCQATAGGTR